jgi:hypothetical protein
MQHYGTCKRGVILLTLLSAALLSACGLVEVKLRLPANPPPATSATPAPTARPTVAAQGTPTPYSTSAVAASVATTPTLTAPPATPPSGTHRLLTRPVSGSLLLQTALTTVSLRLDGKSADGKWLAGDLKVTRLSADQLKQTSTVMTGTLTSRTLVYMTKQTGDFELRQMGIYRLSTGAYYMVEYVRSSGMGCMPLQHESEDPFLYHSTPPDTLLLTTQKNLYGTWLGDETLNGIAVRHYAIDAEASNAAALRNEEWDTRELARVLKLTGGDLYLAAQGDYLVRFSAGYAGKLEQYGFDGKARLEFDLTRPQPGASVNVILPLSCANAAVRAKLPETIGKAVQLHPWMLDDKTRNGALKSNVSMMLSGTDKQGQRVNGSLTMALARDGDGRQVLMFEGAQLSRLNLFPDDIPGFRRLSIYTVGDALYMLAEAAGARRVCERLPVRGSGGENSSPEPEDLLYMTMSVDTLYGIPLRDEKVNGILSWHFRLDPAATNSAMAQMDNGNRHVPRLVSGDVYIAQDAEYMTRMIATYEGELDDMDFSGRMTMRYDLSTPQKVQIALPRECQAANAS